MIGTRLIARPTLYTPTILCVSLVVALLGTALVFMNDVVAWHYVLLAVWPLCLAIAFWVHRRKLFLAELFEDGIASNVLGQEQVPYATIMAVQVEEPNRPAYPLHIHHGRGVLSIPSCLGAPTIELQRFLSGLIPQDKFAAITVDLQAFCQSHVEKFGAEKVFAFTPRRNVIKGFRAIPGRAFAIGSIVTGIIWFIAGPVIGAYARHFEGVNWSIAGFCLLLTGTVLAIYFSSRRWLNGGMDKWSDSGLVISPIGLAIIQDKLRGEMKWDELKRLQFPVKRSPFESSVSSRTGSIRLDFDGAGVEIFDIYCHPLDTIHERIKNYWKGS